MLAYRSMNVRLPRLIISGLTAWSLASIAGCGKPDVTALQRMGCEQAAANVDPQSVKQVDALRKALGIAPNVDPVTYCQSIGVKWEPKKPTTSASQPPADN